MKKITFLSLILVASYTQSYAIGFPHRRVNKIVEPKKEIKKDLSQSSKGFEIVVAMFKQAAKIALFK